ncbi:MAG: hypothetical protein EHM80_07320 [Nitrospiraceae bacterium]|nr:MAG: hypothetical protein EHM80_07320 [Nitrospiraceae bacterium]
MGIGSGKERVIVCISSGQVWNDERCECPATADVVVLFLRGASVVQFEVGKVRSSMADDAVADLAGREFGR